jgi:hypothetical protein
VEQARIRKENETGTVPVSSLYSGNNHLPRKNEITAPRIPTTASPNIMKPIGMREPVPGEVVKIRVSRGGGGVYVGRRVGVV